MTCPACEQAEEAPRTADLYHSDCISCTARQIAHSPDAHARERDPDLLRAAMWAAWPDVEQYRRGRSLVWAWIKRLAQ